MADINQVITLGIGTPADIEHFILLGLNVSVTETPITGPGVVGIIYARTLPTITAETMPTIKARTIPTIEV